MIRKSLAIAGLLAASISAGICQEPQPLATPLLEEKFSAYFEQKMPSSTSMGFADTMYDMHEMRVGESPSVLIQESKGYLFCLPQQEDGFMFFDFGKDGHVDYIVDNAMCPNPRSIRADDIMEIIEKIALHKRKGVALPKYVRLIRQPDERIDAAFLGQLRLLEPFLK